MDNNKLLDYIKEVLANMPADWLNLTTHRLDIYNESLAKTQFLEQLEKLFNDQNANPNALSELPTAYDYIRLGHPLSCILEWFIGRSNNISSKNVISFSSKTAPILAVLRKNLLENKKTRILFSGSLPAHFDTDIVQSVYGYHLQLQQVENGSTISPFGGSTIFFMEKEDVCSFDIVSNIDFYVNTHSQLGSVILATEENDHYISEIQHVRRRETIAMTPANCHLALQNLVLPTITKTPSNSESNKTAVLNSIKEITGTNTKPLVASSGLSIQYAIMMGLIHDANENHHDKQIKFIVPPNCYGGTNDQARRVAACLEHVEVVDLLVDGEHNMVDSIDEVLNKIAKEDAVPFIIAEIPTNPRVEVPDLEKLKVVLSQKRYNPKGEQAIDPVFILDQTFCPNVHFLGEGKILSTVRAISYASGSKFPSGGKCTAGYCVSNDLAEALMKKISLHLNLCDNEATNLQYEILATQLPSMNQRIADAYQNTREFVNFIADTLPAAKINFVPPTLAEQGFTPSVFSLRLPANGQTPEEKEAHRQELNHKLINMMITQIPNESKYCVSYGQLKGCYWTIPATSTQGTTKEVDKDYIARVAVSPDLDLELHKKVFKEFAESL